MPALAAATASRWLSRVPIANTWSKWSAPSACRTWATRSDSPCRSIGHARSPARRRSPSAAPATSAARSGSPATSAHRANAARHIVTLRVLRAARLRPSASSSSARASSARPRTNARVPRPTRDMAPIHELSDRSARSRTSVR